MIMGDLNLKFHKLPDECRKFTKEEERRFFPNPGESVLCLLHNGHYAILQFEFKHCSYKRSSEGNDEIIRDGNGETIWTDFSVEFENNQYQTEIIGWYRLYGE